MAALAHLSDAPVMPLSRLLADEARADADRVRAARALAALEQEGAHQALLGAAGQGPEPVRTRVRELLAELHGPFVASVRAALDREAADQVPRRSDLLYALGALAAREPAERVATVEILRAAYETSSAYEIRARAIAALGRVGDGRAGAVLARIRDGSTDPVLRYLATRELANASRDVALPALRSALHDGDPRVRETAALALGRLRDAAAGAGLISAAKQEPWPFVRRAQVEALGELCGPGAGDLLIRANERDRVEVRRAALIGLARCRDPRAREVLLRVLGRAAEEAELRALAARLLGDMHDCAAAHEMAAALDRLRMESQADLALEGVAVATMHALSALGARRWRACAPNPWPRRLCAAPPATATPRSRPLRRRRCNAAPPPPRRTVDDRRGPDRPLRARRRRRARGRGVRDRRCARGGATPRRGRGRRHRAGARRRRRIAAGHLHQGRGTCDAATAR
jgi:HEAT repeat protein